MDKTFKKLMVTSFSHLQGCGPGLHTIRVTTADGTYTLRVNYSYEVRWKEDIKERFNESFFVEDAHLCNVFGDIVTNDVTTDMLWSRFYKKDISIL